MKKDLINVDCPLCGIGHPKTIRKKDGFSIVRCTRCGMMYVNPRLSNQSIEETYRKNSLDNLNYYKASATVDEKTFTKRLSKVEKIIRKGNLLDIGSSTGTFLKVARDRGWKPVGVEMNESSRKYSESRLPGIRIWPTLQEVEGRFSLINLSDVLEHVYDPGSFLKKVSEMLEIGGLILISVPDYESPVAIMFQTKPIEHLSYFTKKTLPSFARIHGLMPIYCKSTSRFRNIRSLFLSSTFNQNKTRKAILNTIISLQLHRPIEWLISHARDDLTMIAVKKPENADNAN